MEPQVLKQEKQHLDDTLKKLKNAKTTLEKMMNEMGEENLERLKELREDPQTEPHDLLFFMQELHEKNAAFNFYDKYQRLEEFEQLLCEPYFSRIDLKEKTTEGEKVQKLYIGKYGYTEKDPLIIDWRAKIASVYYRYRYPQKNITYDTPEGIKTSDLILKRTFEIDEGILIKYYNNDIQLDESELIAEKIEKRTGGVLEDIVQTIQENQMDIIEADPRQICIVQGSVGSGKSTVAIHKLSHIFFNYPELIHPERSILIAKNQILVGYLSTLFPKLGIFNINYKTLRDLVYNMVFREELNFKIDFDLSEDLSKFTYKDIEQIKEKINEVHKDYESQLGEILSDEEYESIVSHIYSQGSTVYENLSEVIGDAEEELNLQKGYLKENPDSIRSYTYKENIKILKKLINRLKKLRLQLRETTLPELSKSLKLPIHDKMGYLDTLIYIFIYSEIIGLRNTVKYEYCVLDEGQDFSVLEYLILGKLVMRGRFCVLGDLNQSYLDEGLSTWDTIKSVVSDAKNASMFELDTNYRSTKPIIDLANKILSPFTDKYLPKSINRRGSEPLYLQTKDNQQLLDVLQDELKNDTQEISKSIGIITFNDNSMKMAEDAVRNLNLPEDKVIRLDSKKRITYIPKGVYLTSFENCKGLEFAKVYVVGLDLNNIKDFTQAKKAFVALTRAMNELTVIS